MYSYLLCTVVTVSPNQSTCARYERLTMEVIKLTPPFTYSYQCGTTLLISYIPVYLYSAAFGIVVEVSRVVILFQLKFDDSRKNILQDFYLPRMSFVVSHLINNLILLLSFGLSCPVLCIGICLSSLITVSSFLVRWGYLVYRRQKVSPDNVGKDRS
jgi:hypothetical protein